MKFGMTIIAITVMSMILTPPLLFADQERRRSDLMKNTETVREIQQSL